MIYKQFQNLSLSALGMGAMRLPVIEQNDARIDQAAVEEMVACAFAGGINYFDTAWGYHAGQSEPALGRALKQYPRDRFYLADKFPGYDLSNMDKVEEIFERQLQKCQVEYFDFYLIHNVCEMNIDPYLDGQYGIMSYLTKQKQNGRIRHLGFSAHGSLDVMRRFLEAYGAEMEFCQIQLNYLDWRFQDAQSKIELLSEYHLPVWVMEPLRGGRLAALSEQEEAVLRGLRPDETIPAWGFRFLQSLPDVAVTLSGMSNLTQLQENLATFEESRPLSEEEMRALLQLADGMVRRVGLPCTACRYCTSHCPQGLDIPTLIGLYNEHRFTNGGFLAPMALSALPAERQPGACLGCKSCEAVCPQRLGIAAAMRDFSSMLGA